MKILLKILVAPFALALSLLAALLVFLLDICAFLLTIASVILAVLGVALFFTPTPIGGIVFLFLAFLLSPYGLQAPPGFLPQTFHHGGKIRFARLRSITSYIPLPLSFLHMIIVSFPAHHPCQDCFSSSRE